MSHAMVPSLGHNCLDMEQELSLIPALAKWKIDLEDQICHGIFFFCYVTDVAVCDMVLVGTELLLTVAVISNMPVSCVLENECVFNAV